MTQLRSATIEDEPFVASVWADPAHELFFPKPGPEDITLARKDGTLFIWEDKGLSLGFARLLHWLPGNIAISEFALARGEQGKGQGRAFLESLLKLLFSDPQTHRVGLDATSDNVAAQTLFKKAGFRQEGTFRECWLRPDGIWADCPFFSMLRSEWEEHPYFGGME